MMGGHIKILFAVVILVIAVIIYVVGALRKWTLRPPTKWTRITEKVTGGIGGWNFLYTVTPDGKLYRENRGRAEPKVLMVSQTEVDAIYQAASHPVAPRTDVVIMDGMGYTFTIYATDGGTWSAPSETGIMDRLYRSRFDN